MFERNFDYKAKSSPLDLTANQSHRLVSISV